MVSGIGNTLAGALVSRKPQRGPVRRLIAVLARTKVLVS